MKIANDIRFTGSGPRSPLMKLILPSNETWVFNYAWQSKPNSIRSSHHGLRQSNGKP